MPQNPTEQAIWPYKLNNIFQTSYVIVFPINIKFRRMYHLCVCRCIADQLPEVSGVGLGCMYWSTTALTGTHLR